MIITKLINNLKCLTEYYQSLLSSVDQIEQTIDDPFITESRTIAASESTYGNVYIQLPIGAQIVSILIFRVGESGFDDVETIEIDSTSISTSSNSLNVSVEFSGTHELNDYEIKVIYYYP